MSELAKTIVYLNYQRISRRWTRIRDTIRARDLRKNILYGIRKKASKWFSEPRVASNSENSRRRVCTSHRGARFSFTEIYCESKAPQARSATWLCEFLRTANEMTRNIKRDYDFAVIFGRDWRCLPNISTAGAAAVGECAGASTSPIG